MRVGLALVAIVFAAGCQATRPPAAHETRAQLPTESFVSIVRLADRLDLDYRGASDGYIEMYGPPDYVMFVEDSRDARINGTSVSLGQPCFRRGSDYVVSARDADLVTSTLASLRAERGLKGAPAAVAPPLAIALPPSGLPAAWRPRPGVPVRDWRWIVIHHMAAPRGSAATIHRMHLGNGWDGLGYHFVIGNGTESGDGVIEIGYRWLDQDKGAHARARPGDDNRWNLHSIGVCLIGDFTQSSPSPRQMEALVRLVRALRTEYDIPAENVVPHHFVHATECPGPRFPWAEFASRIR